MGLPWSSQKRLHLLQRPALSGGETALRPVRLVRSRPDHGLVPRGSLTPATRWVVRRAVFLSQTLHVCHIYLHRGGLGGQCRHIWQSHGVSGFRSFFPTRPSVFVPNRSVRFGLGWVPGSSHTEPEEVRLEV